MAPLSPWRLMRDSLIENNVRIFRTRSDGPPSPCQTGTAARSLRLNKAELAMTFREQKPAYRVFTATIYGLATLAAAVFMLAIFGSVDPARHTAQDYAAIKNVWGNHDTSTASKVPTDISSQSRAAPPK